MRESYVYCTTCENPSRARLRTITLGFRRFDCTVCGDGQAYPLTIGNRLVAWLFLITLTAAAYMAARRGDLPVPGILAVLVSIVVARDLNLIQLVLRARPINPRTGAFIPLGRGMRKRIRLISGALKLTFFFVLLVPLVITVYGMAGGTITDRGDSALDRLAVRSDGHRPRDPEVGGIRTARGGLPEGYVLPLPDLVRRIRPSIVTIEVVDDGQIVSTGSGFFVSPRRVLTCWHVLRDGEACVVRSVHGTFRTSKVLAKDADADLALLDAGAIGTPLTLGAELPREGEEVVVVGTPQGLEHTVSKGIVAAIRDAGSNGPRVQFTAAVSPGSSGSPMLNRLGEVVGIVTSQRTDGQNLNFAISAQRARELKPETPRELRIVRALDRRERVDRRFANARREYDEERLTEAETNLRAALELDPKHDASWNLLGDTYLDLERNAEAVEAFEHAVGIGEEDSAELNNLGVAQIRAGRADAAIANLRRAIELEPGDESFKENLALALALRGRLLAETQQYEQAAKAYRAAIENSPNDLDLKFQLGCVYGMLTYWKSAMETFRFIHRQRPEDAVTLANLVRCYIELGWWSTADSMNAKLAPLDRAKAAGFQRTIEANIKR